MDPVQAQHFAATFVPFIILFGLLFWVFQIVLLWLILRKAGLPGPLALIAMVPTFGALIVLCILAFAKWRVVPAPEYGYQGLPPAGYPPAFPQAHAPGVPPVSGYNAPGAYTPAAPAYPPRQEPPTQS